MQTVHIQPQDASILSQLMQDNESWLMNRILNYARDLDYTKYTSTLIEAWRVSIEGLSKSLLNALQKWQTVPEFSPDDNYAGESDTEFGRIEARQHRLRGVSLSMFMGLMKYYRKSYLDLIEEHQQNFSDPKAMYYLIHRFFDRVEIAFTTEWAGLDSENQIHQLSQRGLELTNEKNLYLTIFESLDTPMLLLSPEFEVQNANQAFLNLFSDNSKPGSYYYGVNKPGVATWFLLDQLKKLSQSSEESSNFEAEIDNKQYLIQIRKMQDVSYKFSGYTVFMTDVTWLKEANRELELLAAVFRNSAQGIVITNHNAKILRINKAFSNITGYTEEEVVGHTPSILKSGKHDSVFYQEMWQELTSKNQWRGQIWNKNKQGKIYPELLNITRVLTEEQEYYIGIFSDITELEEKKLLEMQLLQTHKLRSLGEVAAGIAHEINSPLQFIADNTEFFKQSFQQLSEQLDHSALSPENQERLLEVPVAIDENISGINRIKKIIQSMQILSYPGSKKMQLVIFSKILDSAINVTRNIWKYVAELELNLDPDQIQKQIECHPSEIGQVLINVITNAAQAIEVQKEEQPEHKGQIQIRASYKKNTLQIEIQDNGCGIVSDIQDRIFEPFFTTKQVGQGTGQGLAISYSIIHQRHHGELSFKSQAGKGSTFIITLPLSQSEALTIDQSSG